MKKIPDVSIQQTLSLDETSMSAEFHFTDWPTEITHPRLPHR